MANWVRLHRLHQLMSFYYCLFNIFWDVKRKSNTEALWLCVDWIEKDRECSIFVKLDNLVSTFICSQAPMDWTIRAEATNGVHTKDCAIIHMIIGNPVNALLDKWSLLCFRLYKVPFVYLLSTHAKLLNYAWFVQKGATWHHVFLCLILWHGSLKPLNVFKGHNLINHLQNLIDTLI